MGRAPAGKQHTLTSFEEFVRAMFLHLHIVERLSPLSRNSTWTYSRVIGNLPYQDSTCPSTAFIKA